MDTHRVADGDTATPAWRPRGPGHDAKTRARPAELCRDLLEALDATEGRRRRRKRDTTPDAIGIGIKRELLEAAVADNPDPEGFEEWLVERCAVGGAGTGPYRAMALTILDEWKLSQAADSFRAWLRAGAPSDDKVRAGEADGSTVRMRRTCRGGGGCLMLVAALALPGCADDDRQARERLDLDAGAATVGVAEQLRGDPGYTVYEPPPELGLDSAEAAPGAQTPSADPSRRAGLSADSLARVGGRGPTGAPPAAPSPAAPPVPSADADTVPPAAADTAEAPPG